MEDATTFELVMGYILWGWMWATIASGFVALGVVFYNIIKDCSNAE